MARESPSEPGIKRQIFTTRASSVESAPSLRPSTPPAGRENFCAFANFRNGYSPDTGPGWLTLPTGFAQTFAHMGVVFGLVAGHALADISVEPLVSG